MSGSVICWAICKSAPHPRQPRQHPHHSVFTGRMPFLPPNQQRQRTEGNWHASVKCLNCLWKDVQNLICYSWIFNAQLHIHLSLAQISATVAKIKNFFLWDCFLLAHPVYQQLFPFISMLLVHVSCNYYHSFLHTGSNYRLQSKLWKKISFVHLEQVWVGFINPQNEDIYTTHAHLLAQHNCYL